MRVVVATDGIAGLGGVAASEIIAQEFADRGALVAVVPLATVGTALHDAIERAAPGAPCTAPDSSAAVGCELSDPRDGLVIDLTATRVDDLGRGALGQHPGDRLAHLRALWNGHGPTALVPEGQATRALTGLAGFASTDLRAEGADLAATLAADEEAERWARELGLTPGPGAGAARGLGLLVEAVGGTLTDPLTFLIDRFGLRQTLMEADLVITGADEFNFHALGGPVVKRVASLAGEALRPVIAITGRSFISARELRLGGFEASYPLVTGLADEAPSPQRLAEVAARVALTWAW